MNQKDFLEAFEAKIGTEKLTLRERMVLLVTALLGNEAVRKDICRFTGVDISNISKIKASLKAKNLWQSEIVVVKHQEDSLEEVNTTLKKVNTTPKEVNTTPKEVNTTPKEVNTTPKKVNMTPKKVNMTPKKVNMTPKEVNMTLKSHSDSNPANPPHPLNNNKKNKKNKSACARTYETSDAFLAFWERYPRKHDKFAVQEKWEELMAAGHEPIEIMAGLERAIVYWQKNYDGMAFIPYPLKWLNKGGWMDEENSPLVFEKQVAVTGTGTKRVVAPVVYSAEEEAFLKAYGKKPRGAEDVELFHQAFQRALVEAGSSEVLCKAAQYAVEDCQYFEGSTQKMKRASYWLDDCDYRQWLSRARQAIGCNPQARAPDLADTIIASMDFKR